MKPMWGALALWLTACTHEPLQPPQLPSVARYTPGPALEQTVTAADTHGGQAQRFVAGPDVPAQWWSLFQSPPLDELVRLALQNSPTLAQAGARLRQAEEDRTARASATQRPRLDANLSANRVDIGSNSLGTGGTLLPMPLDLFLASVAVSYQLDLFGANRHELQALQAGIERQRYELEAARLMLAGNVVTTAIREASLREQIAITEERLALQQRRLAIVERLEQIGTASQGDVIAQRLELAQAQTLLPQLQRQLEQLRHRLAVYTGQAPGAAQLPQLRLADLQLPTQLPLSLPAELARQRPDIRAAEALLQQAGERVGVATANLYPQITLSANLGSLASHAGDLFGPGTAFYLLGASLSQPIFRGGELQARRRSAVAAYEQASAAYQEVVLRALQEVADVLRALEADAHTLHSRADAAAMARRHRDIIAARYQAGGVSLYLLLDAERQLQTTLLERTQAVADRYADSAALLQALGGGGW
jgi:NodT family efflux transporter outer membrane factor (OMF) lipoprotein